MQIDSRLVGATSERVFLSLLNENGVFASAYDTPGFDGIVFDIRNEYFKVGKSPFFVQIKCRGSKGQKFNAQGHPQETIDAILNVARELEIPEASLYFVVGFFKNNDIRQIIFYIVPFCCLNKFENKGQYRFWPEKCERVRAEDSRRTTI